MPTYTGNKIITGTLYEDGTIGIMAGFGKQQFTTKGSALLGITELKQKTKMLTPPEPSSFTNIGTTTVSVSSLTQRYAIKVTTTKDSSIGTKNLSIEEIKQKTVIINP